MEHLCAVTKRKKYITPLLGTRAIRENAKSANLEKPPPPLCLRVVC